MVSLEKKWTTGAFPSDGSKGETLVVEVARGLRDLAALRTEWDALFDRVEGASACASFDWASSWWRAFGERADGAGEHTSLFVLSVRNAVGELVGVVPFFESIPRRWHELRRVRLAGDLGHDGVFGMTEEPALLIRPGWESYVLKAVGGEIHRGIASHRWDLATFRTLHDGDDCPLRVAFGDLRSNAWLKTDRRAGSDYADLPQSWAGYRRSLSKSMRDNLGYYPRLLTRDGHDWHVRYVRDPLEMEAAASRLTVLHRARAASQRGRQHCNHIADTPQETFLATLLPRLAERGKAFVAELVADGEVVASQAFLEHRCDLTVFYSGYLEEWYKYSPVFVIDGIVFRNALERGVRRLDFLRNSGQWKSRWGAKSGPALCRATLVNRHPLSVLRYGFYFGSQTLRRNVADRLPVIQDRAARRVKALVGQVYDRLARVAVPLFPFLSRFGSRFAPTMHVAVRLVPLHHH